MRKLTLSEQRWRWGILLAAGAVALSGCALDLGHTPFHCNKGGNPVCPDGYECQQNCCVKEGEEPPPSCLQGGTCGNGKCDPGETNASCAKDCKGTQKDKTVPQQDGGGPPPQDQFVPPPQDQYKPPPPDQYKPPPGQFGALCSTAKPCATGLTCALVTAGATTGFCTKQCFTSGNACTGQPAGTGAYCILSDNSTPKKYFCAFLCKAGTQTWPCPAGLKCNPVDNPPGSGQNSCDP